MNAPSIIVDAIIFWQGNSNENREYSLTTVRNCLLHVAESSGLLISAFGKEYIFFQVPSQYFAKLRRRRCRWILFS